MVATVWPVIKSKLADAPELAAKTLFEWLRTERPSEFDEGQLRTLQRRVRDWRAIEGPDKEVYFAQRHIPGDAMQTDFAWCNELTITIGEQPFEHMLCHPVLPYSNWEWAQGLRGRFLTPQAAASSEALALLVARAGRVESVASSTTLSARAAATNDLVLELLHLPSRRPMSDAAMHMS
ncbi:MAG: hypothetical protein IT380_26275 [Myxococcales bacterium]|nr:hypothetical protein [Myxococcales bacterium]